ncbi:hypothetical protein [Silanimonas lenta]|uniref:hypothetical protein n=1 Tax=Silanimonas lenta TaxID=265429 RepID=UPI002FE2C46F
MRVILEKEPEGPKKVGHRKTVISVTGSGKWQKSLQFNEIQNILQSNFLVIFGLSITFLPGNLKRH